MSVTRYHCAHAWLPTGVADDVLVEVVGGRIVAVRPGTPADAPDAAGAVRLAGITLPGMANAHSHAFHRALRGRAQRGRGTFWTWREQMYAVAEALDPDTYHALAVATYAEMALAGITCVGEFHYLHHGPGGVRYSDPNAMGEALIAAAADAGIRITLLDTLYLTAGVDGRPLEGTQLRFGDGSFDAWSDRLDRLRPRPHARIGASAHSVRAVPADVLAEFSVRTEGLPTHVHLSEQRAENDACLAVHGRTPTELLADRGLLGRRVTAVHATHLTDSDRAELGDSGTGVCFCPTTERDLADGIGHARALADAGSPLSVGSDSHAIIDPFEEARGLEMHERLHTEHRGHFTGLELMAAATAAGHAALGWSHAGSIAVGSRADLVTVALDSPRTAGTDPAAIAFAATASDVRHVVVDGRVVVRDGVHIAVPDVGAALIHALSAITTPPTAGPAERHAPPADSTPSDSTAPNSAAPGSTASDSMMPGNAAPSSTALGSVTPDSAAPASTALGSMTPDSAAPSSTASDSAAPGNTAFGTASVRDPALGGAAASPRAADGNVAGDASAAGRDAGGQSAGAAPSRMDAEDAGAGRQSTSGAGLQSGRVGAGHGAGSRSGAPR